MKAKALGYPTPSPSVGQASNLEASALETIYLAEKVRLPRLDDQPRLTDKSKASYIFTILAPLALGFVKGSILFFYRRVFCIGIGIRDPFDLATRIMLVLLAMWSVSFCFAFGFACGLNFKLKWRPVTIAGWACPNPELIVVAYVISDAILDLGLLIMPLPSVWLLSPWSG